MPGREIVGMLDIGDGKECVGAVHVFNFEESQIELYKAEVAWIIKHRLNASTTRQTIRDNPLN